MPTTYTKNKVHIYAWRQKNIDADQWLIDYVLDKYGFSKKQIII
jgi:hypothetical protein